VRFIVISQRNCMCRLLSFYYCVFIPGSLCSPTLLNHSVEPCFFFFLEETLPLDVLAGSDIFLLSIAVLRHRDQKQHRKERFRDLQRP